jgi:transposase
MSTFVNTDTGQVLGIVDGRNSTGIQDWLDARTEAWRDGVEVVAIDPSATFRAAIETALPHTRISVDHWHLVRLANLMVTKVRQRVAQETNATGAARTTSRGPTACCSCAPGTSSPSAPCIGSTASSLTTTRPGRSVPPGA